MTKRTTVIVVAILAAGATLGVKRLLHLQTANAVPRSLQRPTETVTTLVAHRERWPAIVDAVGSGVVASMDLDKAEADLRGTTGRVAEIQAIIERKTLRAPFFPPLPESARSMPVSTWPVARRSSGYGRSIRST